MADALVEVLNRVGYQPVLLPATGLEPPDLYNYAKVDGRARLIRRGPLTAYLPDGVKLTVRRSALADISYKQTSSKSLSGAVDFLSQCLSVLGITAVPRLDLSFTGSKNFVFSFVGVTSLRVEPSDIDFSLKRLQLGAIPDDYVERGFLHIAYDYAFAASLTMQRSDGRAFAAGADVDIGQFVQVGANAKVAVDTENTIAFHATTNKLPAFAYKAGRLVRDTRWRFYPEETLRSGGDEARRPFVMRRGVVLEAI